MEFKYCEIVTMKCNEIADFKCHDFMEFIMDSTGTNKIFHSKAGEFFFKIFSVTFSPEQ